MWQPQVECGTNAQFPFQNANNTPQPKKKHKTTKENTKLLTNNPRKHNFNLVRNLNVAIN